EHRSEGTTLKIPSKVSWDQNLPKSFSGKINNTGNIKINVNIEARAEAISPTAPDPGSLSGGLTIRVGNLEWREEGVSGWSNSPETINIDLNKKKNEYGCNYYGGTLSLSTNIVPQSAGNDIEITFHPISSAVGFAKGYNVDSIEIQGVSPASAAKYNYILTQSGTASASVDLGTTWFGDGPVQWSPAALQYSPSDSDMTDNSWSRSDISSYRGFSENLLKEVLDLQRVGALKIEADLVGRYNNNKILEYEGSMSSTAEYFMYAGGRYTSTLGHWEPTLMRISVNAGSDEFEEVEKEISVDSGTVDAVGGGGSGGGSSDWDNITNNPFENSDPSDFADAIHNHDGRYYKKADADGRFFNVSGDTVAGESTFEDIVNIDSYLDFGGDGRLQGNNAGALEILDNAGTNNGELQLHKLTVTNIEIDGEIDQRNVNDLAVKDQYISLNYGTTGTPTLNAGLRVNQGTQTDQFWLFDQGKMDWG